MSKDLLMFLFGGLMGFYLAYHIIRSIQTGEADTPRYTFHWKKEPIGFISVLFFQSFIALMLIVGFCFFLNDFLS